LRALTFAVLLGLNSVVAQEDAVLAIAAGPSDTLQESWKAYVARFIQADGRVVDSRRGGISTSEGQAYAMLRAVWMRDRAIFDKAYAWGRNHLNTGVRNDRLWAWKWGKSAAGKRQVLDSAFASDADQDVAVALILAFQTWRNDRYREDAKAIMADLWRLSTLEVHGRRFLLAGDKLCKGPVCRLNVSYYLPYAYRVFAVYDTGRNWQDMVDSTYYVLRTSADLTDTHLPPDWILLDTATGHLALSDQKDSAFSYDALRVHWRVVMDLDLFGEPRADRYLKETLPWLIRHWERFGTLPAVISSNGEDLAQYESVEMLAALLPAIGGLRPDIAQAIERKLRVAYRNGLWTDNAGKQDSYYLQNWAWFGTALYEKYLAPFDAFKSGGR